jgi:hypothetical protein
MLKQTIEMSLQPETLGSYLGPPERVRPLAYRFMVERGVLLVRPTGPLRPADFDVIARAVDLWRPQGGLHGLVVVAREFPGWENVAGFVRHIQFARRQRNGVRRAALVIDAEVPRVDPELTGHLMRCELNCFARNLIDGAIAWASA